MWHCRKQHQEQVDHRSGKECRTELLTCRHVRRKVERLTKTPCDCNRPTDEGLRKLRKRSHGRTSRFQCTRCLSMERHGWEGDACVVCRLPRATLERCMESYSVLWNQGNRPHPKGALLGGGREGSAERGVADSERGPSRERGHSKESDAQRKSCGAESEPSKTVGDILPPHSSKGGVQPPNQSTLRRSGRARHEWGRHLRDGVEQDIHLVVGGTVVTGVLVEE